MFNQVVINNNSILRLSQLRYCPRFEIFLFVTLATHDILRDTSPLSSNLSLSSIYLSSNSGRAESEASVTVKNVW